MASAPLGKPPSLWHRRVVKPLVSQLIQGATPEKLAQSLAWGGVLGIFPILGTTMLLCGLIAIRFKLNHIAIQTVNWLVYPLQILLIIPFLRLGNIIFAREQFPLSLVEISNAFATDFWSAANELGWVALRGIVAWSILAVPLALILTLLLTPMLRHLRDKVFGIGVR
ncbi:MAG TPA: DUF2062 domain-containing protein [Kiritimatiellia bacterium]|nr:DUF2062 domain-containing protein [Kiritimatiellia bacterium]